MVADLAAGPRDATPVGFTAWGPAVAFVSDDGRGNERLWRRRDDGRVELIGSALQSRLR